MESGEGIESSELLCWQHVKRALVESGEGIESNSWLPGFLILGFLVESGEGIESLLQTGESPSISPPQWNPVKELKAYPAALNRSRSTFPWNPVKELKGPEIVSPLIALRVESGEGIERVQDAINRLWEILWNPVKELKDHLTSRYAAERKYAWNPVKELKVTSQ